MQIECIIEHLEKNENIPSYDKAYYITELTKLKQNKEKEDNEELAIDESDNTIYTIIEAKIDDGTITCEDIDQLINEAFKSSITDRIQRRVRRTEDERHIDNPTGHQKLSEPSMAGRVTPKVSKKHSQMHHRGKSGHDRSTKTQQRNAANGRVG